MMHIFDVQAAVVKLLQETPSYLGCDKMVLFVPCLP